MKGGIIVHDFSISAYSFQGIKMAQSMSLLIIVLLVIESTQGDPRNDQNQQHCTREDCNTDNYTDNTKGFERIILFVH